jgi:hypothetical protein
MVWCRAPILPSQSTGVSFNQSIHEAAMQTLKYVHWKDGGAFLGYLEEYPDYWTQGDTLEELKENLADLFRDINSGDLPGIRRVDELVVQ